MDMRDDSKRKTTLLTRESAQEECVWSTQRYHGQGCADSSSSPPPFDLHHRDGPYQKSSADKTLKTHHGPPSTPRRKSPAASSPGTLPPQPRNATSPRLESAYQFTNRGLASEKSYRKISQHLVGSGLPASPSGSRRRDRSRNSAPPESGRRYHLADRVPRLLNDEDYHSVNAFQDQPISATEILEDYDVVGRMMQKANMREQALIRAVGGRKGQTGWWCQLTTCVYGRPKTARTYRSNYPT